MSDFIDQTSSNFQGDFISLFEKDDKTSQYKRVYVQAIEIKSTFLHILVREKHYYIPSAYDILDSRYWMGNVLFFVLIEGSSGKKELYPIKNRSNIIEQDNIVNYTTFSEEERKKAIDEDVQLQNIKQIAEEEINSLISTYDEVYNVLQQSISPHFKSSQVSRVSDFQRSEKKAKKIAKVVPSRYRKEMRKGNLLSDSSRNKKKWKAAKIEFNK